MMMMSGRAGGGGGAAAGRYPFTATQWQELEQQALIYKCLASGKPIPTYLMPPLRRILDTAIATSPSLAFPPPSSLGWGCYGMGFGRKADEDPEPGRCRRTDGKKWRCSKEAYPDSKYCEKHMHRGKNRSRKPVEVTSPSPAAGGGGGGGGYRPSALSISLHANDVPTYGHHQHQLHHGVSSVRAPSSQAAASTLQLHFDAGLHAESPPPSYHRYDQTHAHAAAPLFPARYGGYGSSEAVPSKQRDELDEFERRRQHFLALGVDLGLDKPPAAAAATDKPLRRFLDEWPRESSDGRRAEDETQLSMSIPAASPSDRASAASRYHDGE